MNVGPKGPTGPQGAQGPEYTVSPYMHKMSVSRDELGLPPRTAAVMDAEKKVVDFFSAANKTRRGLDAECPVCQAAVIVRLRGRDGRAFLGCSRYPQCSGSIDVPDQAQDEAKNWERQFMASGRTASMLPNRHSDAVDDEDIDEALGRGMPPGRLTGIAGHSGHSFAWEDGVFHTFKAVKDITVGDRIKIRSRHEFYFDGKTLLYLHKEDFLPEMRGLLHVDWVKHLGASEVREIEQYRARIKREKEKMMKEAADQADVEVPDNGIRARLARSAKKAPYRMARMRALTTGKKALLAVAKSRVKPAAYDMIEAFLDTDAGQGAVIGLIGLAGPMTPKLGKNKHVQALSEEFLDEGVAKGFNQVLSLVAMIVEPALESAIREMPGVDAIADKVVPKRRKKRVATSVPEARVSRSDEEEEEDEREGRPKNALRAIPSR
jgi:ssDNA-binding Zn-finger/Zn-ribbon topoisomerase 1